MALSQAVEISLWNIVTQRWIEKAFFGFSRSFREWKHEIMLKGLQRILNSKLKSKYVYNCTHVALEMLPPESNTSCLNPKKENEFDFHNPVKSRPLYTTSELPIYMKLWKFNTLYKLYMTIIQMAQQRVQLLINTENIEDSDRELYHSIIERAYNRYKVPGPQFWKKSHNKPVL